MEGGELRWTASCLLIRLQRTWYCIENSLHILGDQVPRQTFRKLKYYGRTLKEAGMRFSHDLMPKDVI